MHGNRILWLVLLLSFTVLNLWALTTDGLAAFPDAITLGNSWSKVIWADLLIALAMVLTWMWRDARSRGVSPIPYLILTLATGSIGTLLYVVLHNRPKAVAENR